MIDEISDTRLQKIVKKKIGSNKSDLKLFKSTYHCGSKIITAGAGLGYQPAVFLLANHETAKYYGVTTCKNPWFCPVCSARVMAKYAAEISCALDALRTPKYGNQIAFMITLTVPHTSGMPCAETTEILYDSWKAFVIRGNKNMNSGWYANDESERGKHGRQKILKRGKTKCNDPFASFCEEFNCKHRVRVGEFTWGEHGWHPHFHCLFWVDKSKFNKVAQWQDKLCERWIEIVKRQTLKHWNKKAPDKKADNKVRLEIMYRRLNEESKPLYISTDKNGKVIEQMSSMYICGWGADKELTGNVRNKATAEGHYTPYQMLQKFEETNDEKWLDLYMEFARACKVKKHRRINFSVHSGIKQIIAEWKKTKTYKETMKKKAMAEREQKGKWHLVYWFDERQWKDILLANLDYKILETTHNIVKAYQPLIALSLIRRCIDHILEENAIPITTRDHLHGKHIEELFNYNEDCKVA